MMTRNNILILVAFGAIFSLATSPVRAVDSVNGPSVGGVGRGSYVTAGNGRSSDDGLARPGFPSRTGSGMIGVTPGGVSAGINKGTDDGFHLSGLGKTMLGGLTRSTMETVPGRTPTYINILGGTRSAPLMGSRGP